MWRSGDASGQVRGRRREEVAAVERSRDGLERVVGVGQFVCGLDATEALGRRGQEPVVRPDVHPALGVA